MSIEQKIAEILAESKANAATDVEAETTLAEETVETTEASVVETAPDESENKAMASAVEWLSKSVLKSTKNLK